MPNHTILDSRALDITANDSWYALSLPELPDGLVVHEIALSELLHKSERLDLVLPLHDVLEPSGLLSELLTLITHRSSRTAVWADTSVSEDSLDKLLAGMKDKDQPLLHALDLIVFYMPLFADGRSFSQAKYLRLQGYQGEIRVAGAFGQDQIVYLLRSGVDSFVIANDELNDSIGCAFTALPSAYSGNNVNELPIFR